MKLNAIEIDPTKIEQGEWITNIPDADDLELKVRGLRNADFRRMQGRLLEAVPRAKKVGGRVDPDEQDKITNQCLAATVLLDWRGLEGPDGQIPYTKEKAHELLTNPRYARFREAVIWAASIVGEDTKAATEEEAGN